MKRLILLTLILVFCSGSTVVLACSVGPGSTVIEDNYAAVRLSGVISAAVLLMSIVLFFLRERKGLWVIVASILLFILHPVWFFGGGGGDCGYAMVRLAMPLTVLGGVFAAHQLRSWLIERSR